MANQRIAKRKAESSNVIIAQKAVGQNNVDVSNFLTRSKTLNNQKITNAEGLLKFRKSVQDRIDAEHQRYILSTQGVLDDKTLDFLISHSNINAPTLTSIFAGYQLAKAARAKNTKEGLDFRVESARAEEERETQLAGLRNQALDNDLVQEKTILDQSLANTTSIAGAESADLKEIQSDNDALDKEEAATQRTAIKAAADVEKAKIVAASKKEEDKKTGVSSLFETGGSKDPVLPRVGDKKEVPVTNAQGEVLTPFIDATATPDVITTPDTITTPVVEPPEAPVIEDQPISLFDQRQSLFDSVAQDPSDVNIESLLAIEDQLAAEGVGLDQTPAAASVRGLGVLNRQLAGLDADDPSQGAVLAEVDRFRTKVTDDLEQSRVDKLAELNSALLASQNAAIKAGDNEADRLRFEANARTIQDQIDGLVT